jgi:hypothetical protein
MGRAEGPCFIVPFGAGGQRNRNSLLSIFARAILRLASKFAGGRRRSRSGKAGFTHVTARQIAHPPKATFVTRLQAPVLRHRPPGGDLASGHEWLSIAAVPRDPGTPFRQLVNPAVIADAAGVVLSLEEDDADAISIVGAA